MKYQIKRIAVLFIMFAFSGLLYSATLEETFEKFSKVSSIESSFKMERFVSIAQKPFISSGNFNFKKPNQLKWQYDLPYKYGFLIKDKKTYSWEYDDKGKKEVKDISNQKMAKAMIGYIYTFITMDNKALEKIYLIESFKDGIVLYPKNKSKGQEIEKIEIYLSKKIIAVEKVIILNTNGDKTIISFSQTKINQKQPENAFEL